ncbi:MAG: TatD DNase family protein [Chloroflexi bacterium]|jgi:TatD DNase family protein|nr:MAG: TatD DNase family protein [Chloroflexota bacterium]
MLIDTHVHLDAFPDSEIEAILGRGHDVGVGFVICAGTTVDSSIRSVDLSRRFPSFFAGVGVHPMDISKPLTTEDYQALTELASTEPKVIVMSEIGLDYMEGMPDRAWQFPAFREQISIARALKLPIVFHSREAHQDCFRVLKEEKGYEVGGIMHYFQGSLEEAKQVIDLGFYISVARPIFQLPHLQEVVAKVPIENIVIETDTAPQPFKKNRDNWTEPRYLRPIMEKIAELKEMDISIVEASLFQNTQKLLSGQWDIVTKFVSNS